MKRSIIYITIAILALFIGVVSTWVYQINYPRFQSKWVSGNPMASTHNFESSDGGEISLYRDITSAAHTHYLFQSNLTAHSRVIGQNSRLNEKGQKIGERAVAVSAAGSASIFWTEGNEFWCIQAPSLELAEEFEDSEMFRSARSNHGLRPTANSVAFIRVTALCVRRVMSDVRPLRIVLETWQKIEHDSRNT